MNKKIILVIFEVVGLLLIGATIGVGIFEILETRTCVFLNCTESDSQAEVQSQVEVIKNISAKNDMLIPVIEKEVVNDIKKQDDTIEIKKDDFIYSEYGGRIVKRDTEFSDDMIDAKEYSKGLYKNSNQIAEQMKNSCLSLSSLDTQMGFLSIDYQEPFLEEGINAGIVEYIEGSVTDSDLFIALLQKNYLEDGLLARDLCKGKNNKIYVVMTQGGDIFQLAEWDDVKLKDFIKYEAIDSMYDLNYAFVPEFINGNHLIETFGNIEGVMFWEYNFLNAKSKKADVVEDCVVGIDWNSTKKDDFKNTLKYKFECSKEFLIK